MLAVFGERIAQIGERRLGVMHTYKGLKRDFVILIALVVLLAIVKLAG